MNSIEFHNVSKKYKNKIVFEEANFAIAKGEFTVITGESGAGKSTLLNIMGGLDEPSEGRVLIKGREIWKMTTTERTKFYRQEVGIIFQGSYLQPQLTLRENILLPAIFAGEEKSARAVELAEYLGIAESLDSLPREVSGGQAERACIARALLLKPKIILADEPTANLDPKNAKKVLEILDSLREEMEITIVVASHDEMVKKFARQLVAVGDKRVEAYER